MESEPWDWHAVSLLQGDAGSKDLPQGTTATRCMGWVRMAARRHI